MRLTDKTAPTLALPAGKSEVIYFDDRLAGFGLRLRANGSKRWIFQYRAGHHQRRLTLGALGVMTAVKARATAEDLDAKVHLGADPAREKAAARLYVGRTFISTANDYLAYTDRELRPATMAAMRRYLLVCAHPLHGVELNQIGRQDIAAQLARVEREHGPVAANRARSAWSAMFAWAMCEGIADGNPVTTTNQRAETPRDRVLSDSEIRALWRALRADDHGDIIRLLLLTASAAARSAIYAGVKSISSAPWSRCRRPGRRTSANTSCRYPHRHWPSSKPGRAIASTSSVSPVPPASAAGESAQAARRRHRTGRDPTAVDRARPAAHRGDENGRHRYRAAHPRSAPESRQRAQGRRRRHLQQIVVCAAEAAGARPLGCAPARGRRGQ